MLELAGNGARLLSALTLVLAYTAYCVFQYRRFHRQDAGSAAHLPLPLPNAGVPVTRPVWLIYASQTGQAEAIARQTANLMGASGDAVRVSRIDEAWREQVRDARCVLFVVSTHGEGSAPDHAARFARTCMRAPDATLHGVRYGVLALGDRSYAQFCAFGRALDAWLAASGAHALFPRVESDGLDGQSLGAWSQAVGKLSPQVTGAANVEVQPFATLLQAGTGFAEWQFIERTCLNAGSAGTALCKVKLKAPAGVASTWQAGDLADVLVADEPEHPRNYSLANVCSEDSPADGMLELIVRTRIRDDGQIGKASGLLNERAMANDKITLRVRRNPGFRLDAGTDTPLILIGAGAGLAGLRAHLMARAHALSKAGVPPPERCAWLIFGERSAEYDRPCHDEFERWQSEGVLTRADFTYSRDTPERPYVQHAILENAAILRDWLEHGASVLVCGAATTMAKGVDEALRSILGSERVDDLIEAGRIRRDVF